jgi:retinol dehydrogenase 12
VSAAMGEAPVCVVTGATSGIGWEVARILAHRGTTVIGIGRDAGRCRSSEDTLRREAAGGMVRYLAADLSSLTQVREAAAAIAADVPRVDVLVNNAGTFSFRRKESDDGVELQLAVNWLAAYALTGLLLPRLLASPGARVVTVSSGSHFAGRMHWHDLQLRHGYNGLKAYDQSKLATVLFTKELARRLGARADLAAYAVDPGLVRTDIGRKAGNRLVSLAWRWRTRHGIDARAAAQSVCWCAVEKEAAGRSGGYWKERRVVAPSERAEDLLDAWKLWEAGAALSGISYLS